MNQNNHQVVLDLLLWFENPCMEFDTITGFNCRGLNQTGHVEGKREVFVLCWMEWFKTWVIKVVGWFCARLKTSFSTQASEEGWFSCKISPFSFYRNLYIISYYFCYTKFSSILRILLLLFLTGTVCVPWLILWAMKLMILQILKLTVS